MNFVNILPLDAYNKNIIATNFQYFLIEKLTTYEELCIKISKYFYLKNNFQLNFM